MSDLDDLERTAQGEVVPTIIITHDVTDTDHWLSSPKREELLPSLGASNLRTFVNPQDRTKVGLVMDIADLAPTLQSVARAAQLPPS